MTWEFNLGLIGLAVVLGAAVVQLGLARISHQGDTGLKFQAPTGSNTARSV